jgi:hypothetical protein
VFYVFFVAALLLHVLRSRICNLSLASLHRLVPVYSWSMNGEGEAAGDVLTGGIIAGTIEKSTGKRDERGRTQSHSSCLNCGNPLTGEFCAVCGQRAHVHRSLLSLGHDILHGVFHFEGKVWRTLPELFFRPGRLTRRYINGERAKFVSPMALFLFTVFLMFATFSVTGILDSESIDADNIPIAADWKAGNQTAMETTQEEIEALRARLEEPNLSDADRAKIEEDISGLESARLVMQALANGDFSKFAELEELKKKRPEAAETQEQTQHDTWPPPGSRLRRSIEHIQKNPDLLLYKIKTNAYKFSWALIPLSVPFMWLLFFWRRDIHLYDHAIFVTYSISFMMLLFIVLSLGTLVGAGAAIWGSAFVLIPPLHMYKQLRGAYGISRSGALVRLWFLLIFASVVLSLFVVLLSVLGAFG